ncbi:MAG: hypothetical protein JW920_03430 [Deltaproteobacteria bacterium]|nr:hypothetical protein [Deltaproteobacteria bacterium]
MPDQSEQKYLIHPAAILRAIGKRTRDAFVRTVRNMNIAPGIDKASGLDSMPVLP